MKRFELNLFRGFSRLLIVLTLCFMVQLIYSEMFLGNNSVQALGEEESVEVIKIAEEAKGEELFFDGHTEPASAARIMPGIGGDLVEVYPEVGERVEIGDPIAKLEAEKLELGIKAGEKALQQIEKELEMAETGAREEEIEQAEARHEAARKNFEIAENYFERIEYLYENEVAARSELDEAEQKLNEARAEYRLAEQELEIAEKGARPKEIDMLKAAVAEAEYELEQARIDQRDLEVTAPVDGVIGELPVDEGALVGDDTVLAVIMEMEELKFSVETTAGRSADIYRGQPAELSFDSHPDETFHGVVVEIYPAADEETGQFEFKIAIPNPGGRLRAGEYGEARLAADEGEGDYPEIPETALSDGDNPKIYLVENRMLKEIEVEVVSRSENQVKIAADIEKGDLIVKNARDDFYHGHPAELIEVVDR